MPSTDRKPFPKETDEFADDERISYSRKAETYVLEDPTTGEEFEWLATHRAWIPVTDEALIAQQASVFAIPGVDENEPAFDPRRAKRKAAGDEDVERPGSRNGKKAKRDTRPTAIYVTGIPLDATRDEIVSVFDRFGVITESLDTDEKRIYMYSDDGGKFKGDALIIYFKPESVTMAIQMLDDSDFRPGKKDPNGPMRVEVADPSRRAQKDKVYSNDDAKEKGSNAHRDRAKAIRKREELTARISNWDEDEEPQTLRPPKTSRYDKIVVIKRMFTPEDAKDPVEMMEIEKELREEAEKHGQVSRVLLYDKEDDGVATVRFVDEQAARACAATFSARKYDGQPVEAYIATGNERFKKSEKGEEVDDEDARLEAAVRATET